MVFFSGCSEELKKNLRETRAQALVEKNKLDAVQALRRREELEAVSVEQLLVKQLTNAAKMSNQLKKQTCDAKLGGWAETVADSFTKSVAEKAPSSVPSLESVGYGKSALKSSDGSFISETRLAEYKERYRQFELGVQEMESFVASDYDDALRALKNEFEDVAYTAEERIERNLIEKLVEKMQYAGLGSAVIEDVTGINLGY